MAETAVTHEAVRLGIEVLKPISDGCRYDLVFHVGGAFLRVQCKWAPRHGGVVIVRCYSARRNRDGIVRRTYRAEEVDAFAAYCPELRQCYFLPLAEFVGRTHIQLRLEPARNNQTARVNWADDYRFEARLSCPGAVAQLGERSAGSRKVRGSIPLGSIRCRIDNISAATQGFWCPIARGRTEWTYEPPRPPAFQARARSRRRCAAGESSGDQCSDHEGRERQPQHGACIADVLCAHKRIVACQGDIHGTNPRDGLVSSSRGLTTKGGRSRSCTRCGASRW